MSNEKGSIIPPRQRPAQTAPKAEEMSEEDRKSREEEIIKSAPLRSSEAEATNAPAGEQRPRKKKTKPWRQGFDLSGEELMQMVTKTSVNQTKELELRMAFIVNEMNLNRGFGPRVFLRDLIVQAFDEFTTKKLKEMGYDVD